MKYNPLTRKGTYNVVRQDSQDLLDFVFLSFLVKPRKNQVNPVDPV